MIKYFIIQFVSNISYIGLYCCKSYTWKAVACWSEYQLKKKKCILNI